MDLLYVLGSIVATVLFLWYVPVRVGVTIEGVFSEKKSTSDLFTGKALTVYMFEDYCKECILNEGANVGGIASWLFGNCHETVPTNIWMIGKEPEPGESVKLTVYVSVLFKMVVCRWERTDFKLIPEVVSEIRERSYQRRFKKQ